MSYREPQNPTGDRSRLIFWQRFKRWFLWGGKEPRQAPPQCVYCIRLRDDACAAYPGGIPFPILANQVDHRNKHPLDRGIRFAPASVEADAAQRALFEP